MSLFRSCGPLLVACLIACGPGEAPAPDTIISGVYALNVEVVVDTCSPAAIPGKQGRVGIVAVPEGMNVGVPTDPYRGPGLAMGQQRFDLLAENDYQLSYTRTPCPDRAVDSTWSLTSIWSDAFQIRHDQRWRGADTCPEPWPTAINGTCETQLHFNYDLVTPCLAPCDLRDEPLSDPPFSELTCVCP